MTSKDTDYPKVDYSKETVEMVKPTIKIPQELMEQLTSALEHALYDVGMLTKETKDKEVYPIKYITLDEGKWRMAFSVIVKERKTEPPEEIYK